MIDPRKPRMVPGQEPYTPAELDRLYAAVSDAAAGDPGERDEAPIHDPSGRACALAGRLISGASTSEPDACKACLADARAGVPDWIESFG